MSSEVRDDEERESIRLAIQSWEKGMGRFCQRVAAKKKPHLDLATLEKRAKYLIQHARHLLIQLLEKRQSLKALIEGFTKEWREELRERLAQPQHTKPILAHTLQCLVRCQDGLMLLTSGECRHPEDVKEAARTRFPSRLPTMQERADGYTKLYSGEAYSGFGWDEFNNETVGIRSRFEKLLRPFHKKPLEYLESSLQLTDALIDRQEDATKDLQNSLQTLKNEIAQDITKKLAKPTLFTTQDKMEKLVVAVPGRGKRKEEKISIARLANNFQILGASVLPNHFRTRDSWRPILSLKLRKCDEEKSSGNAMPGKKLMRINILEDSDSSSDEGDKLPKARKEKISRIQQCNNTKQTFQTLGLNVKVEISKQQSEIQDSVRAIKTQMGVDTFELEQSRQELEHEGRLGATGIHVAVFSEEEETVHRMRKILQRVESRQGLDRDEDEVWDARESLREAWMNLGNHILESKTPRRNLAKARECFEEARRLVRQQRAVHKKTVAEANDQTPVSRSIGRRLLYVLITATTNIGITLLESAEDGQGAKRKQVLRAIRELRHARETVAELKRQLCVDLNAIPAHSENWIRLKTEALDTDIVECLTCRALATAVWESGSNECMASAAKIFEEAWSIFPGFHIACRDRFHDQLLELAMRSSECCYALADLAYLKLRNLGSGAKEDGDDLFALVSRACRARMSLLVQVEKSNGKMTDISEVGSWEDTRRQLEQIEQWWSRMREGYEKSRSADTAKMQLHHGDISSQGATRPPRRFVVVGCLQQKFHLLTGTQRNRGERRHGSSQSTAIDSSTFENGEINSPQKLPMQRSVHFRKWGDDLLWLGKDDEEGNSLGSIPYPTGPPPIPAHLKVKFEKQRSRGEQKRVTQ